MFGVEYSPNLVSYLQVNGGREENESIKDGI
jgi:hypothetical protein